MKRIISIFTAWFFVCGFILAPQQTHPYGKYFKDGVSVGNLENSSNWQEMSGLTNPRLAANSAYLWVNADSPSNIIAAISKSNGSNQGVLTLTGATAMVDLEDIESCSVNGTNYLYGMDYGNNGNSANSRGSGIDMRIFRIVEPTITGGNQSTSSFIEINVAFPAVDGPALRDTEATLVDPQTCDIYMIPKRNATQQVYRLNYAESYSGTQTLTYMGTMSFAVPSVTTSALGATACYLVDAAISPNGKEILIKNYDNIYRFPRDPATQTIYQAIDTETPEEISYVGGGSVSPRKSHPSQEPQGEGISFDYDGKDLYSTSEYLTTEGSSATQYPLFKYERLANKAPTTYTFQEGVSSYAGTSDTYIWDTNPTTNNGSATSMVVDTATGVETDQRKSLLKFDISTIPSTCKVVSARLDLYINTEGQGFKFHRMLVDWTESSTYNSLTGGVDNDGTDAAVEIDNQNGINLDTITGSVRNNMSVDTVQGWVNGTYSNYGWLIEQINSATGDGVQFDTSEGATSGRRPLLTVKCQ